MEETSDSKKSSRTNVDSKKSSRTNVETSDSNKSSRTNEEGTSSTLESETDSETEKKCVEHPFDMGPRTCQSESLGPVSCGTHPALYQPDNMEDDDYVQNLEKEYQLLNVSFMRLLSQNSRMQFRVQQLLQSSPRKREQLLCGMNTVMAEAAKDASCDTSQIKRERRAMGTIRCKQRQLIQKVRSQLCMLEIAERLEPIPYPISDMQMNDTQDTQDKQDKKDKKGKKEKKRQGIEEPASYSCQKGQDPYEEQRRLFADNQYVVKNKPRNSRRRSSIKSLEGCDLTAMTTSSSSSPARRSRLKAGYARFPLQPAMTCASSPAMSRTFAQ